jgi:hypothetical protein
MNPHVFVPAGCAEDDVTTRDKKASGALLTMTILGGSVKTDEAVVGVYENVAVLFCMPLRCTAFDCNSEVARTP